MLTDFKEKMMARLAREGYHLNTCSSCGHNQWVIPEDKMFLCEKCSLIITSEMNMKLYVERPIINLLNDRTWAINQNYREGRLVCSYDPSLDRGMNEDLF